MKDGYQPKARTCTKPPNKGSNLLHPSADAEGVNQLPPKLRQIEFRKAVVEFRNSFGMVLKIKGYIVEHDPNLGGKEFLRICKEPNLESEFTMMKASNVLYIYASKKEGVAW